MERKREEIVEDRGGLKYNRFGQVPRLNKTFEINQFLLNVNLT